MPLSFYNATFSRILIEEGMHRARKASGVRRQTTLENGAEAQNNGGIASMIEAEERAAQAAASEETTPHDECDVLVKEDAPSACNTPLASWERFRSLLPCILGLTCARLGLIVGSYGSYSATDEGFFTDGSMLVTLVFIFVGLLLVSRVESFVGKRIVNALFHLSVIGEALSLVALVACAAFGGDICRFIVSCFLTLFASLAMMCWLRRARGASNATAVVFAFGALAISEVILYPFSLMPPAIAWVLAAFLTLVQFPCLANARKAPRPCDLEPAASAAGYFGMSSTILASKKYLVATAVGIGLLSVVIGLLRGYPTGESIPFTPPTRVAYALLTILLALWFIQQTLAGRRQIMTMLIWIAMQSLCALSLLVYALFPSHLEYGAMLTTTLNALLVGFMWYVIIAFESSGWRDSFYYAFAGWLVVWGCRAASRTILISAIPLQLDSLVINTAIGCVLVLSVQVIFAQFIRTTNLENRNLAKSFEALHQTDAALLEQTREKLRELQHQEQPAHNSTLIKIMGLDGNESFADIRYASMEHNARELGKQFLLSDREIEVVTLYALGFTQKRVAEELFISQGTAHAHIKRIYQKTGLHSRQELLDYMEQYTS